MYSTKSWSAKEVGLLLPLIIFNLHSIFCFVLLCFAFILTELRLENGSFLQTNESRFESSDHWKNQYLYV